MLVRRVGGALGRSLPLAAAPARSRPCCRHLGSSAHPSPPHSDAESDPAAAAAQAERRAQSAAPQHKSVGLSAALHEYLVSVSVRQTPELAALHAETCALPGGISRMVSPPDSVAILQLLLKLSNATRAVEVGVFTGYTALGMALALPPSGTLVACEKEAKWPAIGRPYWEAAGVASRIDLRIGAAAETLEGLMESGEAGSFDLGFIDASTTPHPCPSPSCPDLLLHACGC